MKKYLILFILTIFSCHPDPKLNEQWKKEIVETEKAFADMAREVGIQEAFTAFADEGAVLNRGDAIISGRDSISIFYSERLKGDVKLEWRPDFVEVSRSGDLGYTYGKYTFTSFDSLGNASKSHGIFHTVWKKQEDGTWKYLWD
jgi:ketosteroid isomerase-like protein